MHETGCCWYAASELESCCGWTSLDHFISAILYGRQSCNRFSSITKSATRSAFCHNFEYYGHDSRETFHLRVFHSVLSLSTLLVGDLLEGENPLLSSEHHSKWVNTRRIKLNISSRCIQMRLTYNQPAIWAIELSRRSVDKLIKLVEPINFVCFFSTWGLFARLAVRKFMKVLGDKTG